MKYEINLPLAIYEQGHRDNQEDSIYPALDKATTQDRLFILCDGMGGHAKGEVASQTVCQALSSQVLSMAQPGQPFTDEQLVGAMQAVYDELDAKDAGQDSRKMGTTLVFVYFHAGGVMVAHIGDSRYYHIRPKTNEIIYRSRDHSLVNMRFEMGELSLEELSSAEGKNVILKAVTPHAESRIMPEIVHIKDVKPDDWFFLCSDGMLEQMSDQELVNVLANKQLTDEQKRACLIASTENNQDNHSAYLIHVMGVMSELIDEDQPDDEADAYAKNLVLRAEKGDYPAGDLHQPDNSSLLEDYELTPSEPSEVPASQGIPVEQVYNEAHAMTFKKGTKNGKLLGLVIGVVVLLIFVITFLLISNKKQEKPKAISIPAQSTEQIDLDYKAEPKATSERNTYSGSKNDNTPVATPSKKVTKLPQLPKPSKVAPATPSQSTGKKTSPISKTTSTPNNFNKQIVNQVVKNGKNSETESTRSTSETNNRRGEDKASSSKN